MRAFEPDAFEAKRSVNAHRRTARGTTTPVHGVQVAIGGHPYDPVELHCEVARIRIRWVRRPAYLSHWTAAYLWDLTDFWLPLDQVSCTLDGAPRSDTRAGLKIFGGRLAPQDKRSVYFHDVGGFTPNYMMPMTSVERTLVDCARTLPTDTGIRLAEAAAAQGLVDLGALRDCVERAARQTGVAQARQVLAWLEEHDPGAAVPAVEPRPRTVSYMRYSEDVRAARRRLAEERGQLQPRGLLDDWWDVDEWDPAEWDGDDADDLDGDGTADGPRPGGGTEAA